MDLFSATVLVVSPHLDDAILSCSALLQRQNAVDVLNVFDGAPAADVRSAWDLGRGFATSGESVAARRLEDDAAFAGTPHRRFSLALLDHQYQGRRSGADEDALTGFVRAWAADHEGGVVAVPLGGGRGPRAFPRGPFARVLPPRRPPPHPDHLFVRDALIAELRTANNVTTLLYEEYPYILAKRRLRPGHFPRSSDGRRAMELVVPVSLDEKLERSRAYRSQLGADWLARIPPFERYWQLVRLPSDPVGVLS